MNLPVGTLLQGGKYRIDKVIGCGGFGCTYLAVHTKIGMPFAIKEFFVSDFCVRDADGATMSVPSVTRRPLVTRLLDKFLDEAKALFAFNHPGIVKINDIFDENGTAYIVMQYIDGNTLQGIIKSRGRIPEARALKYIRQAAEALDYVHAKNRLHLDIKPGNIMIDSDDNALLIDFGVSKQYDEVSGENTSTLMGYTVGYAPLEQTGNRIGSFFPATDIYSLGATLYALITGTTPPSASDLANDTDLPPIPDGLASKSTRDAITAAMQPRRKDRPQSITEFLAILDGKAAAADPEVTIKASVSPTVAVAETTRQKPRPENVKPVNVQPEIVQPQKNEETIYENPAVNRETRQPVNFHQQITPQPSKPKVKLVYGHVESESSGNKFSGGLKKSAYAIIFIAIIVIVGGILWLNNDSNNSTGVSRGTQESQTNHQWVDLGLPSGLKWATCNIGADSPSDDGDYFAWGETSTYTQHDSRWYGVSYSGLQSQNVIDSRGNLLPQYDAACQKWGGSWRMPTEAEIEELINICTWTWTTQDGKSGYRVTGTNGNSIFLPAAGYRAGSDLNYAGSRGNYWSATACDDDGRAYSLYFYSPYHYSSGISRYYGRSIRPVTE